MKERDSYKPHWAARFGSSAIESDAAARVVVQGNGVTAHPARTLQLFKIRAERWSFACLLVYLEKRCEHGPKYVRPIAGATAAPMDS